MHMNPHQVYNQQQQLLALQAQQRAAQQQMPMQQVGMNPQMMLMMQQMMNNPAMMQQMIGMMAGAQPVPQQPYNSPVIGNNGQPVTAARFGGGPIQPPQPQQAFVQGADASRFSSQPEPEEEPEQVYTGSFELPVLNVQSKQASYPLTKKLGITPKVTAFNPKTLHQSDKVSMCFSIQDAAEQVAESFLDLEETKTLVSADSVIIDDGFSVSTEVNQLINLFQDDVKGLYKRLRTAYSEITSIDTAIMLNRIDERFTTLTNEYLKTHIAIGITIDRFSTDFNDLLKVLRDSFEDEEDDLWEYLSKEVKEIYELLNDQPEEERKVFRLLSGITLVCFKEHHFKAGLIEVKKELTKINSHETNNLFLLTLAKHVFETADRKTFYFSTYDRELFKFSTNNKNDVFVERV